MNAAILSEYGPVTLTLNTRLGYKVHKRGELVRRTDDYNEARELFMDTVEHYQTERLGPGSHSRILRRHKGTKLIVEVATHAYNDPVEYKVIYRDTVIFESFDTLRAHAMMNEWCNACDMTEFLRNVLIPRRGGL